MTAADIAAIQTMIRQLPASAEIRAIVADHFAYSLGERHPKLVPDCLAWKRACHRESTISAAVYGGPFAEAAQAERVAFGLQESGE